MGSGDSVFFWVWLVIVILYPIGVLLSNDTFFDEPTVQPRGIAHFDFWMMLCSILFFWMVSL